MAIKWNQDSMIDFNCAPDNPQIQRCINPQLSESTGLWSSKVSPNKLNGDIFTLDEYKGAMDTITTDCGINNYMVVRADLRLDSYGEDDYKAFAKLNRYLISAIALTYKVDNCYKTNDLWSQEQLSVAIKNKYFQLENYDKTAESGGKDLAAARFEEREICSTGVDIEKAFTETWFNRWDKAIQNLKGVEQRYNDELEKIWWRDKDARPCIFEGLKGFIMRYQDCIFTRRQLIDLITRTGESANPESYAKKYKKRYGIEYFSKKDVEYAIAEIKRATLEFFPPQEIQAEAS